MSRDEFNGYESHSKNIADNINGHPITQLGHAYSAILTYSRAWIGLLYCTQSRPLAAFKKFVQIHRGACGESDTSSGRPNVPVARAQPDCCNRRSACPQAHISPQVPETH
eukprot:304502-Pleurochrysis_carterae.AAC.1